MGELEPRVEEVPAEETDVVSREVNEIIETFRGDLEANGIDLEKSEKIIRAMLVQAFKEGVRSLEE